MGLPRDRPQPPEVERWRDEGLDAEFLRARGVVPELPAHLHPTWQLGLVVEGALAMRVHGTETKVLASQCVLLPPRVAHQIVGANGREADYVQVELPERIALGDWPKRDLSLVTEPHLVAAFIALVASSREEQPRSARLARLAVLVTKLQRLARTADGTAPRDEVVEALRARLDATHVPIPLDELVNQSGVSRATLLRRFRRQVGTTPHHYQLSVRLRAACAAIDAGQSIAVAAARLGFCDQSHLTRHARRVLAMRPAHWRDRRRVSG